MRAGFRNWKLEIGNFMLGLLAVCLAANLFSNCKKYEVPPRILVFTKTAGYRHQSIPAGVAALRKLCNAHGVMLDSTENAEDFTEENLRRYAAVVFLNTTGDVLDHRQEADFERFIQAGGGFVGVHAATDTEYGWKWYGGLVGGYFNGHPDQQQATLHVHDHKHPATKHLPAEWSRKDEWYNLKDLNPQVKVLLTIDEKSYSGGTNGDPHPMSWYHEYDGGRAFYTALGHTNESYAEPEFLQHLWGGIEYAIGDGGRLCYEKARRERTPDQTRFVKTVLASELTEPMEFDQFPDGKIMLIERRGALKLFDPTTGQLTIVHKLPVHSAEEDGLMGFAIDPNWAENGWIYLYYSPVEESVNQLSRFVFRGDTLDRASEIVMLKVGTQRQECCHTGGSLQFDSNGYLFLSTGDNTNPFASEGYAPADERLGRSAWDAQKSSANTNDLRGKILRIKPLPDGGYLCPAGNLFNEKDITVPPASFVKSSNPQFLSSSTRPEIYVMGCRNPFRISVDNRRKLLFWGEVGPDAGEPDTARGPQGHDEVNRARAAGNFGWPHFVGNNKPYRRYDFSAKKSGPLMDAAHPINSSPNNTGLRELPPAQPAMIWYPYGPSEEFPMLGVGGRNAMAGPVYYTDQFPANSRFPDYYDGKLITYDWMRGWMMAASLDSLGNLLKLEPLGDSIRLSRPMDMFLDKNGSLWVLEYGTQWFSSNPDARLSRIDYVRGNRPPVAILDVEKTAGAAPFKTRFSVSKSKDYDGDKLNLRLNFGDGSPDFVVNQQTVATGLQDKNGRRQQAKLDSIYHVFDRPGTFEVKLTVTDPAGKFAVVKRKISVGNEPPEVAWDFGGRNRSFYRPGDTLHYQLRINDLEDGSLADGRIAANAVATTIDYLETGFDMTSIAQGHQSAASVAEYSRGKLLIDRSDCKTCHAIDRKVNGPAYQDIAERYRGNEFAVRDLSKKVIKGGSGVWGGTVMSAHPQLSEEDAGEMVRWILTLGDVPKPKQAFAVAGTHPLTLPPPKKPGQKVVPGTFILKATYKDRGSRSQTALESGEIIALRPAFQQAESADSMSRGATTYRPFGGDTVVLNNLKHNGFFMLKRVDLTALRGVSMGVGGGDGKYQYSGGRIELRLGSPRGPKIGEAKITVANGAKMAFSEVNIPLGQPADGRWHDVYFVLKNESSGSSNVAAVDWVRFEF